MVLKKRKKNEKKRREKKGEKRSQGETKKKSWGRKCQLTREGSLVGVVGVGVVLIYWLAVLAHSEEGQLPRQRSGVHCQYLCALL
jgi:hypothetical protein